MRTRSDQEPTSRQLLRRWQVLGLLGLSLCAACSKSEPEKAPSASTSPEPQAPPLPANVDGKLFAQLKEISKTCAISLRDANVNCKNRQLEGLSDQIAQGERSQSKSLDTVAYALAAADEKLATVAATFLHEAFAAPVDEKDPKPISKDTALSLVTSLGKLPDQQAVDAAPATVYAAFSTGVENELYAAIDKRPYKNLAARAYRYLMVAGGMRAWDKVQELAHDTDVQVTLAGLDAPSLMRQKTPEERDKICDWYKGLTSDKRPIVATRASGYLIVCGPTYIEQLLAADEARVNDKQVTKLQLDSYQQMCRAGVVAVTGPTQEQCTRLKKMLTAVLEDKRFEVPTRVNAITMLTVNFPDKDVLGLANKYTKDTDPLISGRATEAATQISHDLAEAAQASAAEKSSARAAK